MGQVIKLVDRKIRSADPFDENERQQVILLARRVTLSMADVASVRGLLTVSLSGYRAQLTAVIELIDDLADPNCREVLLGMVRLAADDLEENYRGLIIELDSLSWAGQKLIAHCHSSVVKGATS